ncbi:MAG: Rrf2 family transcriptional regulator, partial [Clostridia bacterium]
MQLKITSDYAVRIVLHLCTNNISATSKEIASVMCIPEEDIEYIVDWLIDGNIIKEGEDGKLYLAKPKDSITLQDVFNAVGENTIINKCLEKDKCCSRHAIENCPAHRFYS